MSLRRPPIGPAIVWALLVGVASVTPPALIGPPSDGGTVPLDLLLHLVGYAVLGALLVRAGWRPFTAVLVASVFGLGVEAVQFLLPFRTASGLDAVANLAGASIGATATAVLVQPRASDAVARSRRE